LRQASEPLSRPPPVSFSPPNAPPISAPDGPDIDVDDPAVGAGGGEEGLRLANVVGEDGRGEALRRLVVGGDRLVEGAVAHDVEDRREGLGQGDLGLPGHLDQAGRT
jgi:hypothetical protein